MTNNSNYLYQNDLTSRELEILIYLCFGVGNKEIAKKLFISPTTVKTHLSHIYEKLGVNNEGKGHGDGCTKVRAVIKALKLGIVILKDINDKEDHVEEVLDMVKTEV